MYTLIFPLIRKFSKWNHIVGHFIIVTKTTFSLKKSNINNQRYQTDVYFNGEEESQRYVAVSTPVFAKQHCNWGAINNISPLQFRAISFKAASAGNLMAVDDISEMAPNQWRLCDRTCKGRSSSTWGGGQIWFANFFFFQHGWLENFFFSTWLACKLFFFDTRENFLFGG